MTLPMVKVKINKPTFVHDKANDGFIKLIPDWDRYYDASPARSGQFWDFNVWIGENHCIPCHVREVSPEDTRIDLYKWLVIERLNAELAAVLKGKTELEERAAVLERRVSNMGGYYSAASR
jgi:hypothetical protein